MNEKIKRLAKIYGKTPDEIIEQLADQALQNGPPAGIGPRLMWLRGVNNMTRDALAEATGISASSIGAYERGEQEPKAGNITALTAALRCSADYILGLSDRRTNE